MIAFLTAGADLLFTKSRIFTASCGFLFLIWSTTSLTFLGDILMFLAIAVTSIMIKLKLLLPYFFADDFSVILPCPRNVLVGANSPSLWPTIGSEIKTFIKVRPLWIENV